MLLKKYPCEISIHHNHNHPVHAADALRRRRPCAATQEKFIQLLKKGHSPLSAMECHKFDLRNEHGDNYFKAVADGSICPSNFWVYKLFKKLSLKQYGPQCGVEIIEAVKKFCEEYNKEKGSVCCKIEKVEGIHITVAICTPLMQRVHQLLKSSAEIMFVDSSGNMDSMNCRVLLLLTPSVAGGMPLGILITTSESEDVVHNALELWKTLLPQDAFYGRGPSVGPKPVMTDDSTPERNALKLSFQGATLLLCLFHVLQAFWRYLWAREQNVPKEKRSELFHLFKDLVYAEIRAIFHERLEETLSHEELNKYHKVKTHLEDFIPRSAEWALFQRLNLLTRGNETNNYCEANKRILKEKVMNRLKAFNLVQLLDFMLTRYDSYVESRIIDVVNNRALNPFKSRYFFPAEKPVDLKCQKLDKYPNSYCVKNMRKGTVYFVLMEWEICSCEAGKLGRPCKHMCAVVQHFNLSSSLIHPVLQCHNSTMKRVLFHIAQGHVNVPDEWFKSLFDKVHEKPQESESDPSAIFIIYCNIWFTSLFGEQNQQQPAQSGTANVNCDNNDEQVVDDPPAISDADEGTNSKESAFPHDILNETKDALRAIMENYIQLLSDDPQTFHEPMGVFIKQNKLLGNSHAGLVSALHCFGKNSGPPAHGFKKRKGRDIPVQPTAVARRTTYLGGTKRQFTGRPLNAMRSNVLEDTSDHTYGVTSTTKRKPHEPVWSSLPKRTRMPATHRLARCVESSQNIGSTHSRK
ncbi:Cleft lip and palate transmembrane protein 1-like protein [Frankliniella fusca]|uniref:Cleft lip and palate transmembrane protein 1-like protein n=1 Tax=Frankliniella fusca TaxID=407009 RepID=A0AAE1HEN2_9NEOP|nr:Cleft lip and palate transmembrane protein 1-like protein [Frankliniella fusca]